MSFIKRNILFVDDDPVAQTIVNSMLTQAGYVVTCVSNGFEALDLLHRYAFDLMLLDIVMQQMNGLELLKRLKAQPETKDIPVIMLSARDDRAMVLKATQLGAADYLVKPPDRDTFLRKIENALGGRPRFAEVYLSKDSPRAGCEFHFKGKILSIGESGVVISSEIPLETNTFHTIQAPLLKEIGVEAVQFKVVLCQKEHDSYTVYANFLGLKITEVQSIRQWVIEQALKGRTVA
jgi:CheY-like chemotaxis protein